MARQILVVALIFFAIVGMASAAAAPAADASLPAQGPSGDNAVIGNTDDGSQTDAAPVGSPVSSETFPKATSAEGPAGASAACSLHFTSAGAILTTFAGAFIF